jgi:very-short-patch-repair endonuclease
MKGICRKCNQEFERKKYFQTICKKCRGREPVLFKINCFNCGKVIETTKTTRKFCSFSCSSIYNKHGGDLTSLKSFTATYGKEIGAQKFNLCSIKRSNAQKGKDHSLYKKTYITPEYRIKLSNSIKNSEYNKNRKGKALSIAEKQRISNKMKGWVNTLKWFINKFGEELGKQKYLERSKLISEKSHFRIYNKTNKQQISKISQRLFWQIYNTMSVLKSETVYFGELNNEYSCELTHCCFDFVAKDRKKVIEFNGDKFHGNPKFYKPDDSPNPFLKSLLAKEIWSMDEKKNNLARSKGYQVLVVWENDFKENEKNVIKNCIVFLENK